MIHIYSTPGAQVQAAAVHGLLRAAYPDISVEELDPSDHALSADQLSPRWDDLLVVVFADDELPQVLHGPILNEIRSARERGRVCRVVPVYTKEGHPKPPEPLDAVKSIRGIDPGSADGQGLIRRIGALLGLWLRGEERKVFVTHRQADGKDLAAQVTAYLEANGYSAWLDEERLHCCDIVQAEIEQHVAGSHLLLLLDTPQARDSEWIWREVDAAIRGFVPIVPVVLRPTDARDDTAKPGFPNAAELFTHRIEVTLGSNGVVELLDDAALDAMLAAVEGYLSALLRSQRSLADKVEETFRDAGFDWRVLDSRRQLYTATKPDEGATLTRLLSHCSAVSPRLFHAVRAFQQYRTPLPPPDGAHSEPGLNTFNHRLFVYEPPLPRPELDRLARDYGFSQDPLLRLIDSGRLAAFLNRFETDI